MDHLAFGVGNVPVLLGSGGGRAGCGRSVGRTAHAGSSTVSGLPGPLCPLHHTRRKKCFISSNDDYCHAALMLLLFPG